jgi:Helix-turn-helix domain
MAAHIIPSRPSETSDEVRSIIVATISASDAHTRELVRQEIESANQQVFDTKQAAAFLGCLHPQTLITWRAQKCGPPFYKPEVGGIFYLRSDLLAWLKRGLVSHNAKIGGAP